MFSTNSEAKHGSDHSTTLSPWAHAVKHWSQLPLVVAPWNDTWHPFSSLYQRSQSAKADLHQVSNLTMTVVKAVDLHHLYWPSSKESVSMDWKLTVTPFHIRYSNHRWPAFSCGVSSEKPQVCLEAVKLLNTTIRLKTDALRRIIWRIKSNQSVDAVSLSWRVDDDWWCQVIVASGKGIWELASSLTESKRITSQRSVCLFHSNLRNLVFPASRLQSQHAHCMASWAHIVGLHQDARNTNIMGSVQNIGSKCGRCFPDSYSSCSLHSSQL